MVTCSGSCLQQLVLWHLPSGDFVFLISALKKKKGPLASFCLRKTQLLFNEAFRVDQWQPWLFLTDTSRTQLIFVAGRLCLNLMLTISVTFQESHHLPAPLFLHLQD